MTAPPSDSGRERDASRRVLHVAEREMQRLLLDVHDGPVQHMYAALSQVDLLRRDLEARAAADPDILQRTERIRTLLENGLSEIRSFIGAFRPPEFRDRDLQTLFEDLLLQHTTATDTEVSLDVLPPIPAVVLPVKIALYRILQESLSNAYRHGGATRVTVELRARGPRILITIRDNGCGFDPSSAPRDGHFGLAGMSDRVEMIGGRVALFSEPGSGTTIDVEAPSE